MRKNNHANAPFPEIVSGKPGWKIFEDNKAPRTSNLSKEMHVPLDNDCEACGINHSKMIRRHELGHVKWSPQTIGKLNEQEDSQSVEVCEEVRINYMLQQKGLPLTELIVCKELMHVKNMKAIYTYSEYELICYLLGMMWFVPEEHERYYWSKFANNKEFMLFKTDLVEVEESKELTHYRIKQIDWALQQAKTIYEIILTSRRNYQSVVSYHKTRKGAKYLSRLRDDFSEPPTDEQVYEKVRLAKQAERNARAQNRQTNKDKSDSNSKEQTLEEAQLETKQELSKALSQADFNYNPDINDMTGRWGKMTIYTPELNVNLQGKIKGGREYRPMDYGVNPKYMNRWCIDKKVFKQRQRTYGGTILIDASGSMSFSGEDILEIMQLLPAVKIAMYNSSHNSSQGYYSDKGSLRIIGDKGKRVKQDYLSRWSGYGNLVDGPALRWLSKQAPTRIWVSDMFVFGADNTSSANLLKECTQIMRKSGIQRLADIEEVKRFALQLNQL